MQTITFEEISGNYLPLAIIETSEIYYLRLLILVENMQYEVTERNGMAYRRMNIDDILQDLSHYIVGDLFVHSRSPSVMPSLPADYQITEYAEGLLHLYPSKAPIVH